MGLLSWLALGFIIGSAIKGTADRIDRIVSAILSPLFGAVSAVYSCEQQRVAAKAQMEAQAEAIRRQTVRNSRQTY